MKSELDQRLDDAFVAGQYHAYVRSLVGSSTVIAENGSQWSATDTEVKQLAQHATVVRGQENGSHAAWILRTPRSLVETTIITPIKSAAFQTLRQMHMEQNNHG
jgi:hypothetical protein